MSTNTIHDLAWEGTLTEKDLLEADRLQAINEVDSKRLLTPLGAAVFKGHVSTTRLLLQYGADVNKPSGTRTPLWIAVSIMQKEKNVASIVNILLEAGADPNVPSANDKKTAPLLKALEQNRKPEVIRMLVDRGASLKAEDDSKMSAERFAEKKGPKIQSALFADSWRMDRYKAAGMVTGLVLFVVAWSNTTPSQRRKIATGAAILAFMGGAAAINAGRLTAQPTTKSVAGNKSTKVIGGNSTQSATKQTAKVAAENPDIDRPAINNTAPTSSDSIRPTINNITNSITSSTANSTTNSATKPITNEPVQSNGTTKSATENTAKVAAENPDIDQSATNNTAPTFSDSTRPTIDDIANSTISNTAKSTTDNTTEPMINEPRQSNGTAQSSTDNTTKKEVENPNIDQSTTNNTVSTSYDSTQPTIDGIADPMISNAANSAKSVRCESSGATQSATENTAKEVVENPDIDQSTGDNTAPTTSNSAQPTIDNTTNSTISSAADSADSVICEPVQPSGTTQSATDNTTEAATGGPTESATESAADNTSWSASGTPKSPTSATAISEPVQPSSNTQPTTDNNTEADTNNPAQSVTDNTNRSTDGTSESPIGPTAISEPVQSSGSTESIDNTTEAIVDNPAESTADNTNRLADGTSNPPIGDNTQTAVGNTVESTMNNGAQTTADGATQPTASDIQPTNNNAAQLAADGDDEEDDDDDDDNDDDNGTAPPGAILKRFGLGGEFGDDMPPELKELMFEESVAEFKKGIDEYITKTKLDRFFPPDSPFLKTVVRKALYLEQDPDNTLDVKDLTKLSLYQTILYLDDSGSMRKGTRRNDLRDLVRRIASIATRLLPDGEGVELRFINAPTDASYSKPSLDKIDNIIEDLQMWGWTPIGSNLKAKILIPLVYKRLRTEQFTRPVLVSIITDGHPEGPQGRKNQEKRDSLKDAILECGKRLQQYGIESNAVLFQISQIGAEEEATHFLESLRLDEELDDILYCTTDQLDAKYRELQLNHQRLEQYLFSTLLGPILDADPT
ncbi:hypothetical protein TWF281_001341 [Arthrobotrys megalospora]